MARREPAAFTNTVDHEDMDESLWDSPAKSAPESEQQQSGKTAQSSKLSYEDQETKDKALRQELANVHRVNETVEGVLQSLDKARTNMRVSSPSRFKF